jgi:carbon storage regulator
MLVLTRKVGESLRIGNEIEVVLLSRVGNRVRIGVVAPQRLLVLRSELERKDTVQAEGGAE